MAAAKPKNRAMSAPPGGGCFRFSSSKDQSLETSIVDVTTKSPSVAMCRMKITSATTALSLIPMMFKNAKNPSNPTVPQNTLTTGKML
jgi:hypothetical protein